MKDYKSLIDPHRPLNHVAIIMDGNGRWAKKCSLPRIEGHKKGSEIIEPLIESAQSIGIKALSLYTFSTENWSRPKAEVEGLWTIIETFILTKLESIKKNGVKIIISGSFDKIPHSTRKVLDRFIRETRNNRSITVNICLNYGGRQEILDSVNKWLVKRKPGEEITEKKMNRFLYTAGLPDIDLMIRTGGDFRISNFLLWQLAYTEFIFMKVLWPDFRPQHLYKAVYEFQQRERRFGGL